MLKEFYISRYVLDFRTDLLHHRYLNIVYRDFYAANGMVLNVLKSLRKDSSFMKDSSSTMLTTGFYNGIFTRLINST